MGGLLRCNSCLYPLNRRRPKRTAPAPGRKKLRPSLGWCQGADTIRQAAPRHRILKAGTISFGGGTIDCTVRKLSETGAALEVVTPLFIPDRFTPIVQSEQLKRPCHIVWRKEKRLGVAFD